MRPRATRMRRPSTASTSPACSRSARLPPPRTGQAENAMAGTAQSYRRFHPAAYDEMVRTFRWEVPARYNIAADVLDKHEPSRLAMLWEDWQGNERRLTFGDMQSLANRAANVLREAGVERGD